MTPLAVAQPDAAAIEKVLVGGDLSKLTESQRLAYYNNVCQSMGLNPLTQPFQYINLNGKLRLYATKDCTEQLRKIHGVSVTQIEKLFHEGLYIVTAHASDKTGRSDASTGAVSINGLRGEAMANALMKAETKAKRRVTLSICGLGMLDESEVGDIPDAKPTVVNRAMAVLASPDGYEDWVINLEEAAEGGIKPLLAAFMAGTTEMQRHRTTYDLERHESLKAKAEKVQA